MYATYATLSITLYSQSQQNESVFQLDTFSNDTFVNNVFDLIFIWKPLNDVRTNVSDIHCRDINIVCICIYRIDSTILEQKWSTIDCLITVVRQNCTA